ncbi:MAG: transcriptional regulator [Verrucomicrobiota bacterium]
MFEQSVPVAKVVVMNRLAENELMVASELGALERQVVDFFVDGVKVLGMPRSIGEIYGLLFVSQAPLSLDDLVLQLGISKGSASQGVRMLKRLGAVREAAVGEERRTYFEPAVELKRLVGGFIREQIRPHLDSGKVKIVRLEEAAQAESNPERRTFLTERLGRIKHWMRSGGRVLPVLQKLLGE